MTTTRRTFLGGIAATSLPVTVTAARAETSTDRVERLGNELAEALNDYAGGKFHAVVYPSDQAELPVAFVANRRKDRRQEMRECLFRLEQLLLEQTGRPWMIYGTDGPGRIFGLDDRARLHDPRGLFGEKLIHGKMASKVTK